MEHQDEARIRQAISGLAKVEQGMAPAPKWAECGIEEKVERLRAALLGLRPSVDQARRLGNTLQDHQHDALGRIVVPLHHGFAFGVEVGYDPLA